MRQALRIGLVRITLGNADKSRVSLAILLAKKALVRYALTISSDKKLQVGQSREMERRQTPIGQKGG